MKDKNLKKLKALIADDEDSNQICFTVALEKEGWEVKQAKDGQEAIEKVLAWQPDLLILDHQMPKLTGAEVYQYLQLQGIKLAVVMISGDSKLEKIASYLGITYYLQRPFDMAEFIQTIDSAYQNFIN
jgi:two-component system response regulator (stage 0 sporulation protein F)